MPKGKIRFYILFLSTIVLLLAAIIRLRYHFLASINSHMMVVLTVILVIILLVLFFFGVFLSWWLIRLAQKNSALLKHLLKTNAWLFSFLDNQARNDLRESVLEQAAQENRPVDEEILEAIQKPKSRGRASNYSYEVRRRTVLAWENRGPNFSYTLSEFLDERFGSSSAGMPNVPNDTFYYWRKKYDSGLQVSDDINSFLCKLCSVMYHFVTM